METKTYKVIGYYRDKKDSWCTSEEAISTLDAMQQSVRFIYRIQKIRLHDIVVVAVVHNGFVESIKCKDGEEILVG